MVEERSDAILRVEGLKVSYRIGDRSVEAVRGVDLTVKRGEVVAIVGESGSGKSTVAQAIMNLLAPNAEVTGGDILFDGHSLRGLSDARWREIRGRAMGLVPQDPSLSLNPVRRVGSAATMAAGSMTSHTSARPTAAPSSCSRWRGSPTRPNGRSSIRTSSPAA